MRRLKRCAVIVVGIAGAAIVLGCGNQQPTPPPGLNEVQLAGWQAYIDLNCGGCHGDNRKGQRSGPALAGLAQHWSGDQLVSYLTDPNAVLKTSPRLRRISERYIVGMPSVSAKAPGYGAKARVEKLRALAEYLLVDIPQTAHEWSGIGGRVGNQAPGDGSGHDSARHVYQASPGGEHAERS